MFMRILLLALLTPILLAGPATAADPPKAGPKDRCAVCGMFVAPYPNWVAAIVFKDGTRAFFDGPKDMFIYFLDLPKYRPGATAAEIEGVYVTEYYSTRLVDAREVLFVTGSDVLGPMGKELVPVDPESAATFKLDHHGERVMKFDGTALVEVPAGNG